MEQEGFLLTSKTLNFFGIIIDIIALGWLARDWTYSRYDYNSWKREHRDFRAGVMNDLTKLWSKFHGPAEDPMPQWKELKVDDIEDLIGRFPESSDAESSKKRRIEAITKNFGVGPSDDELFEIRKHLLKLLPTLDGVAAFRDRRRQETFRLAFGLLLIGLLMQAIGSWPEPWSVHLFAGEDAS
ncbi:MAG: hypothetical protein AAGD43_24380 [Pseudomonadota bacterium]